MTDLADRLLSATGADSAIDRALAETFRQPIRPYTSTVDDARALVAAILPGWSLHLGFDARGIFPYAALTRGNIHLESEAAALPLAIIRVAVQAAAMPDDAPCEGQSAPPEA